MKSLFSTSAGEYQSRNSSPLFENACTKKRSAISAILWPKQTKNLLCESMHAKMIYTQKYSIWVVEGWRKLRPEGFPLTNYSSTAILICVICRLFHHGLAESLQCFRNNTNFYGSCTTCCAINSQNHSHSWPWKDTMASFFYVYRSDGFVFITSPLLIIIGVAFFLWALLRHYLTGFSNLWLNEKS